MKATYFRNLVSSQQYTLLEKNRKIIESVERTTYDYGTTDSHKLDVYAPILSSVPETQPASKPPIFLFFYGGGFTRGARINPSQELVHANFGAFFALKGILTAIADYRLVPSVSSPGGSEDVRDALAWISLSLCDIGDISRLFVMGHSAGGVHLSGYMLNPSIYNQSIRISGIILLGVPYEIPVGNKAVSDFRSAAKLYYGDAKKVAANQPLGMLRRANKDWVVALPPLRNMMAAREPRYLASAVRTFGQLYASKGGTVQTNVLDGHDHLSPIGSLCTGEGEEWGIEVAEWILSNLS
ncbi:alpha/beta-hydrolase [Pholiota conissans]|uniref:Alpha/beta-hydrolase n=1 Tax=Pholiota conissans TaxID=109636 RepID=A0A9P5Z7A5_9AGAR|nr:alpha/beta-hydrolase [Pholiota conissans]